MEKPRYKLPEACKAGDVIDIKAVIIDPMETGNRRDPNGAIIPRKIINLFVATFNDVEVFRAAFGPGISANPYLSFTLRVPGPGQLVFAWTDDDGQKITETATLNVTA